MKKLMTAAAIVCAAVGVQAAQFDWAFESDDDMGDYTVAADATYYLISGDAGVGAALATILTTEGKGADAFKAALSDYNYQTGALVDGFAGGDEGITMTGVTKDYAALFIFNDGVVEEKTFAYNEYDVSGDIYTPPDGKPIHGFYASDWGDEDYASAWGAGTVAKAIPEPTSGLLLLLGMAGLALRRRRA